MTVLIAIPVYNEAPTVGHVAAAAAAYGPVLVVDDGSADDSATIARAAGAAVIRHPRRLGKGQALRTAIAAARARGASAVLTLDGDAQHDPRDIPAMLAAAARAPRAVIVGRRTGDAATFPSGRVNAMRVATFFANFASGVTVADTQSGFRLYPIVLFDDVRPRTGGFVLETEILLDAAERGWPMIEVDVAVAPRATRRSRFRPLLDGVAIGACVAGRVVRRAGIEIRDAACEVTALAHPDRRRPRHAAVIDAARGYADSLPNWALAVGVGFAGRAALRLAAWYRHPRPRRALVVLRALLAAPLLVVAALVHAVAGRWLPDLLTPIVTVLFSSSALDHAGVRARERRTASIAASGGRAAHVVETVVAEPPGNRGALEGVAGGRGPR